MKLKLTIFIGLFFIFVTNLNANANIVELKVTATAYNSLPSQTDNTPDIAAWGDKLVSGMRVIAVSRDLLKMGLKRNSVVKIKGLPGTYLVKDKMHKRWRNKIDIYMGTSKKKALKWGRKKVTLIWYKGKSS